MKTMECTLVHSSKRRNKILTIAVLIVLLAAMILADQHIIFSDYVQRLIKLSAAYGIAALSMTLIQGYTGLFSLGQAGFMAVGAYTVALCTIPIDVKASLFYVEPAYPWVASLNLSFPIALLLGASLAAILAFFIGFPVLRLKSDYLGIASLGFSEIIRIIIVNWMPLTNSSLGLKSIPSTANVTWCVGLLTVVVFLLLRMMKTTYGRSFKAIRDDEVAAQAMGINLFTHKLKSFIISGFMAGLSGGLIASIIGIVTPTYFKYTLIYDLLLIVIIGGMGSITGAVLASFVITFGKEYLRFLDEGFSIGGFVFPSIAGLRMLIFSILLMVAILFFREGFFGDREFSWDGLFGIAKKVIHKVGTRNRYGKKRGENAK